MSEHEKMEMLYEENQGLKAELRETLELLEAYKKKYGELLEGEHDDKKLDLKKIIHESKDKIQEKMNDEKVKDKIEKGKDLSGKAKQKVLEGSSMAMDAFKTAKKVFFNKEMKDTFKGEFESQRKKRQDHE
ncbi:hypothetical protein CN918_25165 [Priestia megaterium]|nr:hypothetical protein CN918_25165 [Priestia megaterium]